MLARLACVVDLTQGVWKMVSRLSVFWGMRLGISLAAATVGLACCASSASATTLCVDGPTGCSGIAVAKADLQSGALSGGAAPAGTFNDGQPDLIRLAPGTYTSPGGGVVVTSGSTDWSFGLAGKDPAIEQITRNLFDRLAG